MLGFGFGGIVEISSLISLSLDFDYMQSTREHDLILDTFDSNGNPTGQYFVTEIEFKRYNTSISVGFSLIFYG